ncbi:hypothetical protein SAMN05421823_104506 [Catalinimonas alkaloidigena]|uniref:Uncharacterized protein n=2 Tax=Catalinimonas alkaloidigena TaxID=1075417 RepID=A0A1G9HQW8_9BACT|nr:hypothetical protein SAMN05421823_104506 [Catalinimonas alkaloidigena]
MLTQVGKQFWLSTLRDAADEALVRTLFYARWNASMGCWTMPAREETLQKLDTHFGARLRQVLPEAFPPPPTRKNAKVVVPTLQVIVGSNGRLRLQFPFHPHYIAAVKKLPYAQWDPANRWWSVADAPHVREQLASWSQEWKLPLHYAQEPEKAKPRPVRQGIRECPPRYEEKLSLRRYSPRTIKSYTALFREFINYRGGGPL